MLQTGCAIRRPCAPTVGWLAVLIALLAFVGVWTAYFTITELGQSVHHDMAEAYAWGREFQPGYSKHPPFWAWICGLWFSVVPRANWSFALLSVLNSGLGLLGAWALIGRFAEGDKRVSATLLLLLTPFYTFLCNKYNANAIFLSVWPWMAYFFVRAFEARRPLDSVILGMVMGIAALSKYYAIVLGVTLFIAVLVHPARRRYFCSLSPYVSIAVAAFVVAPHLFWLWANDAPPFQYFADEAGRDYVLTSRHVAKAFFASLALNCVAVAAVWFTLPAHVPNVGVVRKIRRRFSEPRLRVLIVLALGPLVLTSIAALALRNKIDSNMLIGVFPLIPLLAIEVTQPFDHAKLKRRAMRLSGALCTGALVASPAVGFLQTRFSDLSQCDEPRRELSEAATGYWRAHTDAPLKIVGGSDRYDAAVAFYSIERPHAFLNLDFNRAPWIRPDDLAADGLLSVCRADDDPCRKTTAKLATPAATSIELKLAHAAWGYSRSPVSFVVTAIPPK